MNTIEEWKRQKKRQRSSLLVSWVIIYSIPCCASYSVLPWTILPFLSNHPGAIHPIIKIVQCKTDCVARNLINSSPQNRSDDLCSFASVFILLLWWKYSQERVSGVNSYSLLTQQTMFPILRDIANIFAILSTKNCHQILFAFHSMQT